MTQRRQRPKNTKTTGVVTLAILCVTGFPKVSLPREKFSWIRQKNNKTDQLR